MTTRKAGLRALLVDDDPDSLHLTALALKGLGIAAEVSATEGEFLAKLSGTKPDFCLVDLNLGTLEAGFSLIRKVRAEPAGTVPLFVLSAYSDAQSIAHAVEVGATDFLVKPLDPGLLASKIESHLNPAALTGPQPSFRHVPAGGSPATLELELELEEIDENGIRFLSPHLIAKGAYLMLSGKFLDRVSGSDEPHAARVASTWVTADGRSYGHYAEFDADDERFLATVRGWLANQGPV